MEILTSLSQRIGSGDVALDAFIIIVALVSLVIGALIDRAAERMKEKRLDQRFDRVSGVAGRLEKLEMTLNTFRTESLRGSEQLRGEVRKLREEVTKLVRSSGGTSSAPSGSEGGEPPPSEPEDQAAAPIEEFVPVEAAPEEIIPEEAPAAPPAEEIPAEEPAPQTLAQRLRRTRAGLFSQLKGIFSAKPVIDAATLEEVEAQLISSDLGVKTVSTLIEQAKLELTQGRSVTERSLIDELKARVLTILRADAPIDAGIRAERRPDGPLIVMMVGVNGVGKTTTTAKLAAQLKGSGAKVLMVAADTFRAAAVEQLSSWGERIGVPVVKGAPDAKPATVVFDAMERTKWDEFDVVLIDTAGRLHTKTNLMQELEGIKNIIKRHQPSGPHEVLLVVDGSTGQNALSQAREFNSALTLSGLVVTKLDGTPKGGIVVAIKEELGVPVRYIGVGESSEDLRLFSPEDFVSALFDFSDSPAEEEKVSAHGETRRRRRRDDEGALVH